MSEASAPRSRRPTSSPATRSATSVRDCSQAVVDAGPDVGEGAMRGGGRRGGTLSSRLLPAAVAAGVASTFHVLGDTTRVRLLAALAAGELPVGDLARLLGMTESAVSHQLRVLKGARMVKARPSGRHVFYALDDLHVLTLFRQALTHVREDTATTDVYR